MYSAKTPQRLIVGENCVFHISVYICIDVLMYLKFNHFDICCVYGPNQYRLYSSTELQQIKPYKHY